MVKKADIGTKRLISLAPEHWVQWVTQQPDIQVEEFLSTEFEWIGRESDVLIKVFSPQWGEFILLQDIIRWDMIPQIWFLNRVIILLPPAPCLLPSPHDYLVT